MAADEEAVMWVEKYRPKTLDEVVDLKDIVESLKVVHAQPENHAPPAPRRHPGHGKNHRRPLHRPRTLRAKLENLHAGTQRFRRKRHRHRPRPRQRLLTLQPRSLRQRTLRPDYSGRERPDDWPCPDGAETNHGDEFPHVTDSSSSATSQAKSSNPSRADAPYSASANSTTKP